MPSLPWVCDISQELRAHFQLPARVAHRARGDTETLAGVFAHLCAVKFSSGDAAAAMDGWLCEDKPACMRMLRDQTACAGAGRIIKLWMANAVHIPTLI